MKKWLFIFLTFIIFCSSFGFKVFSQEMLNIKGSIQDTKNEAIIGASVIVEGTNIGTVSDINGNFMLSAPTEVIKSYLHRIQTFY
jgi:hypothetical protein